MLAGVCPCFHCTGHKIQTSTSNSSIRNQTTTEHWKIHLEDGKYQWGEDQWFVTLRDWVAHFAASQEKGAGCEVHQGSLTQLQITRWEDVPVSVCVCVSVCLRMCVCDHVSVCVHMQDVGQAHVPLHLQENHVILTSIIVLAPSLAVHSDWWKLLTLRMPSHTSRLRRPSRQ